MHFIAAEPGESARVSFCEVSVKADSSALFTVNQKGAPVACTLCCSQMAAWV